MSERRGEERRRREEGRRTKHFHLAGSVSAGPVDSHLNVNFQPPGLVLIAVNPPPPPDVLKLNLSL